MTSITATGTVYIQEDSTFIQYQQGSISGSWTTITSWPVTIINTNIATVLKVIFYTDITLKGGTNRYFNCGSDNIQFGSEILGAGGNRSKIYIEDITNYPGLIGNGNAGSNGQDDIYVVNIEVLATGTTTLATEAGWIGQKLFSKASESIIVNCHSDGDITQESGGIVGMESASESGANLTIIGCTSSGAITGNNAGGMCGRACGYNNGAITIRYCSSSGVINGLRAGGITGRGLLGNVTIEGCYSTGAIGTGSGGITGAFTAGTVTISNSYSVGTIGTNAGGICGSNAAPSSNTVNVSNCYSSGTIGAGAGGIFGNSSGVTAVATNCYIANGSWSDSAANAALLSPIGTYWESTATNTPYEIVGMGATPYTLSNINNLYTSPALDNTYVETVTAGNSTIPAEYGSSFTLLESGDPSITINGTTGDIITTSSTPAATYQLRVRSINNSFYAISTVSLTVTSSGPGPAPAPSAVFSLQNTRRLGTFSFLTNVLSGNVLVADKLTNPKTKYMKYGSYEQYQKYRKIARGTRQDKEKNA